MSSFEGKVAIITGSSSGIGEATALLFAKEKGKVVLAARNTEKLDKVAVEFINQGIPKTDVLVVTCDVTRTEDLQKLVDEALKVFGQIDILVNNAGSANNLTIMESKSDDFDRMMNLHVKAAYELSRMCVPHLIKTKGCVVNVSSAFSRKPAPVSPLYSMAKAALDMFTQALALELATEGVRVNAVNPGVILTPMLTSFYDETTLKQMEERFQVLQPLGGFGKPEYVAKAIRFLASTDSEFVTGHHLSVDSGWHCRMAS